MAADPTAPAPAPSTPDASATRRQFLQVLQGLGAAAVYAPPALVALLADSGTASAQTTGGTPGGSSSESGESSSETSQVTADPGGPQTVHVGKVVTLDGSNSHTTDSSESARLGYEWVFVSLPADSTLDSLH